MISLLEHPLLSEFPEHRDVIVQLKTSDAHFRRLYEEYHEVDKHIVRIEEQIEPATDAFTEGLKVRRLHLKDDLLRAILT
jgi:uncharacterized protein YdcH (DUF465 family)